MTGIDNSMNSEFTLAEPVTEADFKKYFEFRWRWLREPWGKSIGSERDEYESSAFHVMVLNKDLEIIGVGRLHSIGQHKAQIRYMAVDEKNRAKGIGTAILEKLESHAIRSGATELVLNARENAVQFYQHRGYSVTGPADTLFGVIRHKSMLKRLTFSE